MGYIIIDGLGSSRVSNPPDAQALGNLWHYLKGWANSGRNVVINGYGSALGPGQFEAWTPQLVAEFVKAGNVFIDWCEWPMFYQVAVNGSQTTLGASGFQGFAGQIGYTWLTDETFYKGGLSFFVGSYPLVHGYVLKGSQNGVYLPKGDVVYTNNTNLSNPLGNQPRPLQADGMAAMMGLHHPGIGWYFYAAFDPIFGGFFPGSMQRVPHEVYGAFIAAVMHNQLNQFIETDAGSFMVTEASYAAPQQTVAPTTPGPSSPYHVTVSSSTPSRASGSGSASSSARSSSSPSQGAIGITLPPWQEIAAGAALFGGAGIMVAVLVAERRRRLEG